MKIQNFSCLKFCKITFVLRRGLSYGSKMKKSQAFLFKPSNRWPNIGKYAKRYCVIGEFGNRLPPFQGFKKLVHSVKLALNHLRVSPQPSCSLYAAVKQLLLQKQICLCVCRCHACFVSCSIRLPANQTTWPGNHFFYETTKQRNHLGVRKTNYTSIRLFWNFSTLTAVNFASKKRCIATAYYFSWEQR